MNKKILGLSFIFFFFVLFSSQTQAADFLTSFKTSYTFSSDGSALVKNGIILINNQNNVFADSYSFSLQKLKISQVSASQKSKVLDVQTQAKGEVTTIKINLPTKVIGQGKSNDFTLTYRIEGLAQQNGRIWEIIIPKLDNSIEVEDFELEIFVPPDFGSLSISAPAFEEEKREGSNTKLTFKFDKKTGFNLPRLYFGDYRVFSFNLKYHLKNDDWQSGLIPIVLPSKISGRQEIFIQNLEPKPQKLETDPDGNLLAYYRLDYKDRKDITLTGYAKVTNNSNIVKDGKEENLESYLLPARFWEVNDPKISEILLNLAQERGWKDDTSDYIKAKDLYDYVSKTLKYDAQRILPSIERFGAVKALANRNQAVCMEYTDLLITLLRASNIPARELDGYAYAPSFSNRPTVGNVLHAWVEFYSSSKGWRQVDPTWGSTTGQDYYSNLDFNHLAFAIKGMDSELPISPGLYKLTGEEKNDVEVTLVDEIPSNIPTLEKWQESFPQGPGREETIVIALGIVSLVILVFIVVGLKKGRGS